MLSSKTNALLTHTLASFWRKQSCIIFYSQFLYAPYISYSFGPGNIGKGDTGDNFRQFGNMCTTCSKHLCPSPNFPWGINHFPQIQPSGHDTLTLQIAALPG